MMSRAILSCIVACYGLLKIKLKRIKRMLLVGTCMAKDPIPDDKAKVMAENYTKGGHIKVLAQVLWDWQEERSLSIHPLPFHPLILLISSCQD